MTEPRLHRGAARISPRTFLWLAWLLPVPSLATLLVLLWSREYSMGVRLAGTLAPLGATIVVGWFLRSNLAYSLRTLTNVIAAMREGDFSIRPKAADSSDPLGALATEITSLADTLREQRLGALEASALLRTALEELDAAIFTFDDQHRLRLGNRAAERLLARPVEQLLGRTAAELSLAAFLEGDATRVASVTFPGGMGRFGFRRTGFRQGGRPHQLLVVTDLSRALRDEERQAWQRLLRVLGHELNNSLAPIKSVASSLASLCRRDPKPLDWQEDIRAGLSLISTRADALSRFMEAYSQLARLPAPKLRPVPVADWIRRVAGLETRVPIEVQPGPDLQIQADRDQLEQLLINLVRNAADAVLERRESMLPGSMPAPYERRDAGIVIRWARSADTLEIQIEDSGPGIANPANLFVPFFTTKPKGSGIGLPLCRQIAEAHEGRLSLENRTDQSGCLARLRLPLPAQASP